MVNKKQSLVNTVYDYLLEMILSQKIKCGERIPEIAISQQLNISRTPIREAIRRLANVGLINLYPNRFAEVVSFSEQDLKDIGFVRIMLDTASAKLAILHGSNADFGSLGNIADECTAAAQRGEHEKSIELDGKFHMELAKLAQNPLILDMNERIYLKVQLIINIAETRAEDRIPCLEQHYEIIRNLLDRDVDGVQRSIYNHLAGFYHVDEEFDPGYFRNESYAFIS